MMGTNSTRSFYRRLFASAALAFFLLSPVTSWACTSIVVGKDASATGEVLVARTVDWRSNAAWRFVVYPRGFYKGGQTVQLDRNGFTFTFPHDSYKFTGAPMTTVTARAMGGANAAVLPIYDEHGVNEHGLVVSATNTTAFTSGVGSGRNNPLDPVPSSSWREDTITTILLASCKTVNEALALTGQIVETSGIDNSTFMIADKNEAWLVEGISGHRWVASRVPDDSFAVIANDMVTDYVDLNDPQNFRGSADTLTFLQGTSYDKYDDNGRLNIARSYGGNINGTANTYRRWRGYTMFAPSSGITPLLDSSQSYRTFIKPDPGVKISPTDVMYFQRDRYKDTPYDLTTSPQGTTPANGAEAEPSTPRPIGHITQMQAHVYEMRRDYPAEIGARFWMTFGQTESSVNLPFYGLITDTHPYYKIDLVSNDFRGDSAFWIFADIGRKARGNREKYALPIKDYWRAYELKLYDEQPIIEAELLRIYNEKGSDEAAKFITNYTIEVADRAFAKADRIRLALGEHIDANSGDLFVIPETLDDPANETSAQAASPDEEQAVKDILGGEYSIVELLDVKYSAAGNLIPASEAPAVDGYKFTSPASAFAAPIPAQNGVLKLRYAVDLDEAAFAAYGGSIDAIKNSLTFIKAPSIAEEAPVKLIGPDSDALIQSSQAFELGIANIYPTADGAHLTLDYLLADGASEPAFARSRLYLSDGAADSELNSPAIWLAVPYVSETPGGDDGTGGEPSDEPSGGDSSNNSSGSGGGCSTGAGIALMAAAGVISIIRKKSAKI
jgi:dipeptidase